MNPPRSGRRLPAPSSHRPTARSAELGHSGPESSDGVLAAGPCCQLRSGPGVQRRGRGRPPIRRFSGSQAAREQWHDHETLLVAAAKLIDAHLAEVITLNRLCDELGRDARSLTSSFKHFHGQTMSAYLVHFRARVLFHAMAQQPEIPLRNQLNRCGISGTPSERRAFRGQFGRTIEEHQRWCLSPMSQPVEAAPSPAHPSALHEAMACLQNQRDNGC